MGFFDNVFGSKKEQPEPSKGISWIPLNDALQLDGLMEESKKRTQAIFKHSTTCGISGMVLRMFSSTHALEENMDFHFLDLHAHRSVSDAVASKFGVVHQSPQLLLVKNGQVVLHASHGAITDVDLQDYT
ncbi:bacillithiol system redox-active protein YtxJ [Flagellimonas meishanensis]|uniref:bacillithiol system redox-active protein YtxJ n=1 Tax=Flagellimonas meishanensis TaxID=2873264 RepID=UPI001CA6D1C9|nr:bacillithiol system redox-active protein YtxJ [[Muricauda] meishanensis]